MAFDFAILTTAEENMFAGNKDLAKLALPKCRSQPEVHVKSLEPPKTPPR